MDEYYTTCECNAPTVMTLSSHRHGCMDSYNSPTTKALFKANQIVWYVLSVLEAILAIRFFLKLLGANPGAGFTDLMYGLSAPFVAPFLSVFNITPVAAGSVFEWTTLLAMFIYWFVAVGIIQLLMMSKTVSTREAARMLEHQEEV